VDGIVSCEVATNFRFPLWKACVCVCVCTCTCLYACVHVYICICLCACIVCVCACTILFFWSLLHKKQCCGEMWLVGFCWGNGVLCTGKEPRVLTRALVRHGGGEPNLGWKSHPHILLCVVGMHANCCV